MAKPKNTKNPRTSVKVVIKILDDVAGSFPNFFKSTGIKNPTVAATNKLANTDTATITPKIKLAFKTYAKTIANAPTTSPIKKADTNSLK